MLFPSLNTKHGIHSCPDIIQDSQGAMLDLNCFLQDYTSYI